MADVFWWYLYVKELPEMAVEANKLEARLRAAGFPLQADRIVVAWAAHRTELLALGVAVAADGTHILRDTERSTRVRPDTLGGGGPRLEDSLDCEPLPTPLFGSVGIANLGKLDAHVPWWETNEEGSSARVGGRVVGFFQPGDSRPSGIESRQHPLFEPDSGGGLMTIHNPIPARHFIERSVPRISALWLRSFEASLARFEAEKDAAVAEALAL